MRQKIENLINKTENIYFTDILKDENGNKYALCFTGSRKFIKVYRTLKEAYEDILEKYRDGVIWDKNIGIIIRQNN